MRRKFFFPESPEALPHKRIAFSLFLSLILTLDISAQDSTRVNASIFAGDTIPMVYLRPVNVEAVGGALVQAKRIAYYKMKRDVRITLPYAKIAAAKLWEVNNKSLTLKNDRQRRRYIREEEDKMKEIFEDQLKNLTVTQGKVLIKLIDRQTGTTTYDLVKQLRGSLNAYIWQGIAHLWGSDLKIQYDPKGEDAMMEQIVAEVEAEDSVPKK